MQENGWKKNKDKSESPCAARVSRFVLIITQGHTYASLLIADGTPLVVVSKNLGHAQTSTTSDIYSHVIASAEAKAAQVTDKFAEDIHPKSEKRECVVK